MRLLALLFLVVTLSYSAETFHEDFEGTGSDSTWTPTMSSGNTYSVDASHPVSMNNGGTQCCSLLTTYDDCYLAKTVNSAVSMPFIGANIYIQSCNITTAQNFMVFRGAQNASSSTWRIFLEKRYAAPDTIYRVYCTYYNNGSSSNNTAYDTIDITTWHYFGIKYDSSGGSFQFRVDNDTVSTVTLTGTRRNTHYFQIGEDAVTNANDNDCVMFIDNILADDADYPINPINPTLDISGSCGVSFGSNSILSGVPVDLAGVCGVTFGAKLKWGKGWDEAPYKINVDNPGELNAHYAFGVHRVVRSGDTVVALGGSGTREIVFRSTQNGDQGTWTPIDSVATYSGSLLIDSSRTIWYFFRNGTGQRSVNYVKFPIGATTIPAPVYIDSFTTTSTFHTDFPYYTSQAATIDSNNNIYLAAHGDDSNYVKIWKLDNGTTTWDSIAYLSDVAGRFMLDIEAGPDNTIWLTSSDSRHFSAAEMYTSIAHSHNGGTTWAHTEPTLPEGVMATVILPTPTKIHVFAQNTYWTANNNVLWGLIYKSSSDTGATWSNWTLLHKTAGYGDPTCALDSSGNIYIAFRADSLNGTDGQYHFKMAMSTDSGSTWTFPDSCPYPPYERVGAKSACLRYQQWFSGGGPIDWTWMQYESSGTQRMTYYDQYNLNGLSNNGYHEIPVVALSGNCGVTFGTESDLTELLGLSGDCGLSFGNISTLNELLDISGSCGVTFKTWQSLGNNRLGNNYGNKIKAWIRAGFH